MSEQTWNIMNNAYTKDKTALSFLASYDHTDIAVVRMSTISRKPWLISSPHRDNLIADLLSSK